MPKIKLTRTNAIYDWMFQLENITLTEKVVYATIYGLAEHNPYDEGYYTGDQESIAELMNMKRVHMNRAFQNLCKAGLLEKVLVAQRGSSKIYKYRCINPNDEYQNGTRDEYQNGTRDEYQNGTRDEYQNGTQYINNNKYINNNNNNCPKDLNYIQGQAQFDSTEDFDNYVREYSHSSEDKEPLQIQLKKKVSDVTGLNGLDITKIVNTAAAVNKKEDDLLEICRYATQQNCDNLTAYIINLIKNGYSKPQRNIKPNRFVSGCSQRSPEEIQRTAELLERLAQESLARVTTDE